MDIIPLGLSSFLLKGKRTKVVTDPYDQAMVGLKFPKHTSADIITVSHQHPDHNNTGIVEKGENEPVVFLWPGEFEAKGVSVVGIATFHDTQQGKERGKNTIFCIEIDGVHIVHCGDLGHKLTEEQVDAIEFCDILMLPVGGIYSLDAAAAAEVVTQLEPVIVIPMHYQVPGLNPKAFSQLLPVRNFLKEIGQEEVVAQAKLSITKDKLPEKLQVVVLE